MATCRWFPSHLLRSGNRMYCSSAIKNVSRKVSNLPKTSIIRLAKLLQSDSMINQVLSKNQRIEDDQWSMIRQDLMNRFVEDISLEAVIDAKICEICSYYKKFDQAKLYCKFLQRNNLLNLKFIETYLSLYHMNNGKQATTEEDEKEILEICNGVASQQPITDPKTASIYIMGLTLTQNWRAALKLVHVIDITTKIGATSIGSIICAAFRHNKPDIGWNLIHDCVSKSIIHPNVYLDYLNYCQRSFEGNALAFEIEKIFYIWQRNGIHLGKNIVEAYVNLYSALGYTVNYTSVSRDGCCNYCNYRLQSTALSNSEFKALSSGILKFIIIGKGLYSQTSPQELKRYKIFLQTMKPYDAVIDGLNIAYEGKKDGRASLQTILQLIELLQNEKKRRILMIGRAHMKWWSKLEINQISDRADVFLTKNLSDDDPFLLHVTMMSGCDTHFVSNDLMRQHKAKLSDPFLQELFTRWQLSHQYRFERSRGDSPARLIPTLAYRPDAQNGEGGWHLPYTNFFGSRMSEKLNPPDGWVCLKTKN